MPGRSLAVSAGVAKAPGLISRPTASFQTSQLLRGRPDLNQATTNHVEQCNLTGRTQLRRHTRRTNAHSKKLEHHQAAVALHVAYYNWVRVHEN